MKIKTDLRSSKFGILWLILQPLLYLCIYYISFRYLLKSKDVATISSCLAGLISYNWFSQSMNDGTLSLVGSKGITNSTLVPNFVFILSSSIVALWRYVIVFIVFLIYLAFQEGVSSFNFNYFLIIPYILLCFFTLFSFAFLLASIYPVFPDLKHIVDTFTKLFLFISCVFYETKSVPVYIHDIFLINPLSYLITNLRCILFESMSTNYIFVIYHILLSIIIFTLGFMVHKKYNRLYRYINTI